MSRVAVLASLVLVSACRIVLDDGSSTDAGSSADAFVSAACTEAKSHSDLAWIEANVFKSCTFSSCHHGQPGQDAGRIDLRVGQSFAFLVNFPSALDPTRKLVVPSVPNQSYLLMMIRQIPPGMMDPPASAPDPSIGFMPQNSGGSAICAEKRDAVERWIAMGALNN
jgi:hypothetical protein